MDWLDRLQMLKPDLAAVAGALVVVLVGWGLMRGRARGRRGRVARSRTDRLALMLLVLVLAGLAWRLSSIAPAEGPPGAPATAPSPP